jgi:hypothetical protein
MASSAKHCGPPPGSGAGCGCPRRLAATIAAAPAHPGKLGRSASCWNGALAGSK